MGQATNMELSAAENLLVRMIERRTIILNLPHLVNSDGLMDRIYKIKSFNIAEYEQHFYESCINLQSKGTWFFLTQVGFNCLLQSFVLKKVNDQRIVA